MGGTGSAAGRAGDARQGDMALSRTGGMSDVPDITGLLARVRLLVLDCDGVLTDGGVTWAADGVETKTFNIRDGLGIRAWQRAGGRTAIVTGRSSPIVGLRAAELGIEFVRQGIDDKLAAVGEILGACGLSWEEAAYVGDDLPDLPVVARCGLGIAVADAAAELVAAADLVTTRAGGRGAVREVVERLLGARGAWEAVVAGYRGGRGAAGHEGMGRA
jgi:3-deoxy-D-manno-octulosonate 8-phosphate phosphatase (KDO 8-P phosphatase)